MHITIIDNNEFNSNWYQKNLGESFRINFLKKSDSFKLKDNETNLVLVEVDQNCESCKELLNYLICGLPKTVPVLATGSNLFEKDIIDCLNIGIDDFIKRPISNNELNARLLNRISRKKPSMMEDLKVDLYARSVFKGNVPLNLPNLDFSVLTTLVESAGTPVGREALVKQVYGKDWDVMDRGIDNSIARIRKKLGCHPKTPKYIRSIRGEGYMFIGKVSYLESDSSSLMG
jgi:DNA-binding response OmpR family regulator